MSLGSGTMLSITSSLPGSVLSPGQELLGVSWGSPGCRKHPVPALGLLLSPLGWEVTLEPVHLPRLSFVTFPFPHSLT